MTNPVQMSISGDLSGKERVAEISRELEEVCKSTDGTVEADLSGLTSLDYDGIVTILAIRNQQEGSSLRLTNIPIHIQRIIESFKIPV